MNKITDTEIVEQLLLYNESMLEETKKTISQLEAIIAARIKNGDFDVINPLLQRDRLIAKRDTYYTMPGMVEALKEGENDEK